ncbi:hypothetical protein [Streptomyces sp. cg35]|uniref:hypothetical protein n=1 Tax=Streptomyces sp. cg35 TaxID=3421650 RepID=UPI003D1786FE
MAASNAAHNAAMLAHGHAARGQLGTAAHQLPIDESAAWSPAQQMRLTANEARIAALGKAIVEAGEAFGEIKDDELHLRYGLTWAQYCEQGWGLSESYVNRMIAAAPILRAGSGLGLRSEGPARELGSLYSSRGDEGVRELLSGFGDAGVRPTQEALRTVVRTLPKQVPAGVDLRAHARAALAPEAEVIEGEVVEERPAPKAERAALSSGQISLLNEYLKGEASECGVGFDQAAKALLELLFAGQDGQPSTATNMLRARLV